MKYKTTIILILFTSLFSQFCIAKINYPDLSSAQTIIQTRQKELYKQLLDVKKEKSSKYKVAEAYGKLAMFYHAHDYLKVAKELYKKAIDNFPNSSKWFYLLASVNKAEGDFNQAEKAYVKALQLNKEYLPTVVNLAELYLKQGELEKAEKFFQKSLALNNNSARTLLGLGQIQMQRGHTKKAIDFFDKVLKIQPFATRTYFLLSQAYASLGESEKAKKYQNLKGNIQAQLDDPLLQLMYAESRSSSYYNDKAVRAYLSKNYRAAESLAKLSISYNPKSPYPKVTLANVYVATNRADSAIKLLKGIVLEDDKDPNLSYSIGVIEEIIGNDAEAVKWYKKVLEIDSKHKKASVTLASALMRRGKYKEALKQLKFAGKLDPNNPYINHRQAAIYAHQNQCDNALSSIYKAVKEQPKNFAFLLTFVKIAAHCPVDKQTLSDALNAARNMYQISQDDYIVETLAMIEAKNNNFKKALDYQAQVIFQLLKDKSPNASRKIAKLRVNLKRYQQKKYATGLFNKDDIDLNPKSFKKLK